MDLPRLPICANLTNVECNSKIAHPWFTLDPKLLDVFAILPLVIYVNMTDIGLVRLKDLLPSFVYKSNRCNDYTQYSLVVARCFVTMRMLITSRLILHILLRFEGCLMYVYSTVLIVEGNDRDNI